MKSFDGIIRHPKSMARPRLAIGTEAYPRTDLKNSKSQGRSLRTHWPIGAAIVFAAILINSVTLLSAFEAHVIDVTATIERRPNQLDDIVENEKIREVAAMGTVELATSTVPITTTEVKNSTTTIIEAIEAMTAITVIEEALNNPPGGLSGEQSVEQTVLATTTTETTTDQPQPTLPETVETPAPAPEPETLPDIVPEPEPVSPPDEVVSPPDQVSAPEPTAEISTVDN